MYSCCHGTLEHANVGRPANTHLHPFCADTECSLEDLLGVIDDRNEWRRERGRDRQTDRQTDRDTEIQDSR